MRAFEIHVVLVRSIYERNVGAASRAMANMGANRLILIGPQCEITYTAQQAAATGQHALQNRIVYKDWPEFFANEKEGLRFAFSTKDGKGRQLRDFSDCLKWLKTEHEMLSPENSEVLPVYMIFGQEDWGLSNEDIEYSHYNVLIPTFGDNPSLNLAQAVLMGLFILRDAWGGERTEVLLRSSERSTAPNVTFADNSLKIWLEEMGFNIEDRRINAYSVLKRLFFHNVPTSKEVAMVETVFQQGIRKLREYNRMRKENGLPYIDPNEKKFPNPVK
jgi:tRNA/rRNA methyltransferase